uniref:UPAR/Ly6 domain-containing protein n=1 Tax=Podarcis muralis TaxID=64176 RepID=A0A670HUF5_PODMU
MMARLLVLCVAVLACISIGSALQCLKCSFTFHGLPCHTSTTTCQAGEVCATIRGAAGKDTSFISQIILSPRLKPHPFPTSVLCPAVPQ